MAQRAREAIHFHTSVFLRSPINAVIYIIYVNNESDYRAFVLAFADPRCDNGLRRRARRARRPCAGAAKMYI